MFLLRLFHQKPTTEPTHSVTAARLQQGIELHSAFSNGCVHCRGQIGEAETCIIYRNPLRTSHIDCHYDRFRG